MKYTHHPTVDFEASLFSNLLKTHDSSNVFVNKTHVANFHKNGKKPKYFSNAAQKIRDTFLTSWITLLSFIRTSYNNDYVRHRPN